MTIHFDMFGPHIKNQVRGNIDCSLIITKQLYLRYFCKF